MVVLFAEDLFMGMMRFGSKTQRLGRPPTRSRAGLRARLHLELLESRNLLSGGLTLTPLVQVSDVSPLDTTHETPGAHTTNSEVEPQLAVDPTNRSHAVAVYQQDRYAGSGAAALVASVTT